MNTDPLHIAPPQWPAEDRSGALGPRLLHLLATATRRALPTIERFLKTPPATLGGLIEGEFPYPDYFAGICVYTLPLLARCADDATVARTGFARERLVPLARDVLETWVRAIEATPVPPRWPVINVGRSLHDLGMGLWFLLDAVDPDLRQRAAAILAREADRFLAETPRHALEGKSWAEVNAWTSGGLAVVSNLLRRHPHQAQWEQKARTYMIGAYATPADVASERVVDGRPLREWLRGANAFPDHVVENHGFIHPVYLETFCEGVRGAVAYALAGAPLPEAVTFNAEPCFDRLAFLSLPDTTHLYIQGTDYTARRIDSLFQACAIVPLRPTPLRKALLLRALSALETMAERAPDLPICGWPGCPHELGVFWGANQNYLLCRFFGDGGPALPDDQVEAALTGTHVSPGGCFAVRRTARAVASFSWHARMKTPLTMGFAMPLDRDVLLDPMPHCLIGELQAAADTGATPEPDLALRAHQVASDADSFAVALVLARAGGRVRQVCAFTALPDGRCLYIEERRALAPVTIVRSTYGNLTVNDDTRWPFQRGPRRLVGAAGPIAPGPATWSPTGWLNIDDRLGLVAVGTTHLSLMRRAGKPMIFREPDETMFDTLRVAFTDDALAEGPRRFAAGEHIARFALALAPHQTASETAALAEAAAQAGWRESGPGELAFEVSSIALRVRFEAAGASLRIATLEWVPRKK